MKHLDNLGTPKGELHRGPLDSLEYELYHFKIENTLSGDIHDSVYNFLEEYTEEITNTREINEQLRNDTSN